MSLEQPPVIEIAGLTKSYRVGHVIQSSKTVLRDLSLSVLRGEVFGFLGPNGAGKTTTLKLLFGMLFPDSGTLSVFGMPVSEPGWRYRTGYLPENPYLYDYLTAREYIEYAGRLFGLSGAVLGERASGLLQEVGMFEARDVPLRQVSKGMLQRVGLAQALINDPDLVVLDEPMSGLDPLGRRMVKDVITNLRQAGKTVFFSTHILADAEALCERVALLRAGRLLAVGRLDEILGIDYSLLDVVVSGIEGHVLDGVAAIHSRRAMGERFMLEVEAGSLSPVVQRVEGAGGRVLSVAPIRQSLEDYFMEKIQGGGGDAPAPAGSGR